eukprot:CAMPEP_0203794522 /NCGR_PEP_ID=MMETSP0100_2-20121128/6566_1 /ASSEMBLY_ACC=CAM_ASM_000210 /TAXON_ID=96639 /ORGANISM=" , Strain NY0313808BC1" /LENGTH=338 /DNA_ID=CAMNT_0050698619 /DNA_START=238 /DNA_END=1254 /DNA_ORIENTATION=+
MNFEPDLASSSAGWEMRKWFHVMLGASNFLRFCSIIVELSLPGDSITDCDNVNSWVIGMSHGVPDLLFLTTYSLLILFWSQLYYATWGISYASLRPGFVIANNLLYLVFVVIAAASLGKGNYCQLRNNLFNLLAACYICATIAMLYYGIKVISQLRPKSSVSQTFPARKMILVRVVVLCSLCSIVLLLRSVYCVIAIVRLQRSMGYPDKMTEYTFDALTFSGFELLPSFIILLVTVKRNNPGSGPPTPQGAADVASEPGTTATQREIFEDTSAEFYGSSQILLDDRETLSSRLLQSGEQHQDFEQAISRQLLHKEKYLRIRLPSSMGQVRSFWTTGRH